MGKGLYCLGLTLWWGVTCECFVLLAILDFLLGTIVEASVVPMTLLLPVTLRMLLVVLLSSDQGAW